MDKQSLDKLHKQWPNLAEIYLEWWADKDLKVKNKAGNWQTTSIINLSSEPYNTSRMELLFFSLNKLYLILKVIIKPSENLC